MRGCRASLRGHWPEYLMEAAGLAALMIVAATVATLFEATASPVPSLIPAAGMRRALTGLAIGATVIALVYSPWGRQSGAHFNPAVTMTFLHLRRVAPWDAVFYIAAQFIGALAGIGVATVLLGALFTAPPVAFIATLPGPLGELAAFAGEFAAAFLLMTVVLLAAGTPGLARLTGIFAGCLVGLFIFVEGPLSGMSINPARSFSSAALAQNWMGVWIYFTAPVLGMLSAAEFHRRALAGRWPVLCAKLVHDPGKRCIHCGYSPEVAALPPARFAAMERNPHG